MKTCTWWFDCVHVYRWESTNNDAIYCYFSARQPYVAVQVILSWRGAGRIEYRTMSSAG